MSGKQRVRAMDDETSALITASYFVPDLVVAIQEAVYNAIDASARHVNITVDIAQASFCVTDDGNGIHPDEMYEHIFESAATSNTASSSRKYSSHGQFLMALGTLAKEVELESRVENHWTSSRKLVKHARIVFNAHSKTSRVAKGTRLRVENLFHLLPVRQRELASHASARARISKRLSSFFHSLSMIWPTLSIDVSYADAKVPRIVIPGVATCEERLHGVFGDILAREMEYVSFEAEDSPFTVRGYVAVIQDGGSGHAESLESPGWKQARTYYQFVFLDNTWMDDFQRDCCKTINSSAMQLEIGIPIFVLKISARSHEYELHSDGDTRVVNFKRPEALTQTLRGFVQALQNRAVEAENHAAAIADSKIQVKIDPNAQEGGLEAPAAKQSTAPMSNIQAERMHGDVHAATLNAQTQYEGDIYTNAIEELVYPEPEYNFDACCELEQYVEEASYGEDEQALDHPHQQEYVYEYVYEDVMGTYEDTEELEESEAYGGSYDQVYADERTTQDTLPRGCAHCTCGHMRDFDAYSTSDQTEWLHEEEVRVGSVSSRDYTSDDIYYSTHTEALQSSYDTQPQHYEDDSVSEFDLAESDDGDALHQQSDVVSSGAARPTQLKQERSLNELFFGANALHHEPNHTKQLRVQRTAARRLEPEFKEEGHKPQSQWLSSRRFGREVVQGEDASVQAKDANVQVKDASIKVSVDYPVKDEEEEKREKEDDLGDQNVGSDQLSDYFSFEKLVKTHKQPSQLTIASFASKRAALGGTLAPLPGENASGVRVSHLPHDLHSASVRTMTLDKSIFQNLQVIKQVDRKFILVKVTLNARDDAEEAEDADDAENLLLLCIDQHAADERVRLELLEAQVFGASGEEKNVETVELQPSLPVSLNRREHEVLEFFEEEIRSWGFGFEVDEQTTWLTYTPKIDTRVANADDFREYLQLLSKSDPYVARRVLRPPVITRFLHSRACRSAIMFGDYLSRSQCQDIVEQLSQCQLPFQCAHGRPSIVPLVELI